MLLTVTESHRSSEVAFVPKRRSETDGIQHDRQSESRPTGIIPAALSFLEIKDGIGVSRSLRHPDFLGNGPHHPAGVKQRVIP